MNRDWIQSGAPAGEFPWHGPAQPNTRRALVASDHNLKQIWYLERAVEVSRSVARVAFPDNKTFATCFLVAPQIILTNHHVFESKEDTDGVRIQFDYRTRFDGTYDDPEVHTCDPTTFVADADLDFALVALNDAPKRNHLDLRHGDLPERGGHVAIVQHPMGGTLQAALRDNSLIYDDASTIEYLTNTDYGSSGSPVFNDSWNVIALHSARVKDPKITGRTVWYRNRGTPIAAILANQDIDKLLSRPRPSAVA